MNFIILVLTLVSVAMAAPVNPGQSSAGTPAMSPIVSGSSVYMYSPFYYLTAKLKLLPKHIIMCIINPTMCDDSPPTGYVAPATETKVPYTETPVGHPPHVDIFDTSLAASSKLQNGVNETTSLLVEPVAENKQKSIPENSSRLETQELISRRSSTQFNLENLAAQRANFEIPDTEEVRREESKVQFNMPKHRVH